MAGGEVAASEIADILLMPNNSPSGGNFYPWLESVKNKAGKLPKEVALYLSFLETNVIYNAPLPSRAAIIARNTRPGIPAGPDNIPPAVDPVPPTNAIVAAMEQDAYVRRGKLMDSIDSSGTTAWTFLKETISHLSWTSLEEDPRYAAAEQSAIKDAFTLYQIIRTKHAESAAAGGVPLSSQDVQRVKDEFHVFVQGKMDIGDFHKQFLRWLQRRQAAGLADLTENEKVTSFFSKLDPSRYGELLRERENEERKLILLGQPVPATTLSQALALVRGYVSSSGMTSKPDATKKSLSVFTIDSKPNAEEVESACKILAAAVPGSSSESVFLTLKNANFGANTGGGSKTTTSECPPLMVRGKPWTKACSVPGCNAVHPFFLHEVITGKPVDAASKAKIDAFEARKVAQQSKKKKGGTNGRVLVTTNDGESSDESTADHYFVGCATVNANHAVDNDDDDDDDCYSPDKYSVHVVAEASSVSVGTWADAVPVLTCVAIAMVFGYLSVWCVVAFFGHLLATEQLRVLAVRMRSAKASPFDDGHLLFDNQAGASIVRDINVLVNVKKLSARRTIGGIAGDAGALVADFDGELPGFPGLRFLVIPNASANILAECNVEDAGWLVTRSDGIYTITTPTTSLEFRRMEGWHAHPACPMPGYRSALVTTVAGNLAQYSKAQQTYAQRARELQRNLGYPCDQYLINGLSGIENAGVTAADIRRATTIAGPPLAKVRGGTHQTPTPAQRIEAEVPRSTAKVPIIMEIDIFLWRGLSFLIAVLLPIDYVMATYLKHRTVAEIKAAIDGFISAAAGRMFNVTLIQCDGEKAVAAYKDELNRAGVKVESQPGVHAPHVERVNQTISEFVRGQENGGLPYRMCKALIVMGVLYKVSRMNLLPTKASTDGFGSFVTWEGIKVDASRDLKWAFGDYAETVKTNSNKTASRTEACIAGIPTMNRSGSVIFYKLSTRTMVTRQRFHKRPMPDWVIEELNDVADEDNLPGGDEYIGDHSWDFRFEDDVAPAGAPVPPIHLDVVEAGVIGERIGDNGERIGDNVESNVVKIRGGEAQPLVTGVDDVVVQQQVPVAAVAEPQQPLQLPAPARRGRSGAGDSLLSAPGKAFLALKDMEDRASIRKELMQRRHWHDKEFCFKISVRAALRDRGDEAKAAIFDELQNIVDKGVLHGVHMRDLTSTQRKSILRTVTFLKDKYSAQAVFEKYKARMCVDGSKQDHTLYENVSSPTATCASVLSCAAIAAAEGRKVMTVDVKGAFLHADMTLTGVLVHVQLDKVMTGFLVEIDPSYEPYVREDGTCIAQLDKALYGTIEAAKLWYDNISTQLLADGFVQNPYDHCVFNKVNANGIQITVVLYVDDMMVSCEDGTELDTFAAMLRTHYGQDEITEHRGTILDFLGMTFDFTMNGKVKVTMKRLVDEIIAGCGVILERKTPAADHLFDVNESAAKLKESERDYFRSYTAKLLYIGKRVKPEMMTAISFLSTRANSPDVDDLAKLQRALGYLLATRDRGIILSIGDTMTVGGFIDAAYGVHTSTGRSHSGCAMVLGTGGPVHVKSTKQKLVTKSSTEAELVALSDYASQAIWLRNFIIAQGYDVGPVILHQDNMSCMALIKRGGPASERSRHIDIRYFWVKEKVDGKDAIVKHLPTDQMFVNVMTKPVQGQQFIRERNALTNWY